MTDYQKGLSAEINMVEMDKGELEAILTASINIRRVDVHQAYKEVIIEFAYIYSIYN